MSKNGASRPLAGALGLLFLLLPIWAPEGAAQETSSIHLTGIELTAPVQHALLEIQEQWLQWISAFYQNNPERAQVVLDNLQATTHRLGMERLPDLSLGAAVRATEAARQGDFERAAWALEAAEVLDRGRSETAFARSTVARLQGAYLTAAVEHLRGYVRLFALPQERSLFVADALLWAVYVLVVAGGLFVAVLFATRGAALYRDATHIFPFLPRLLVPVAALLCLLWPLALPSGPFWLLLYWSILLWGYGTASERGVLVALWILLGLTPIAVTVQRERVAVALSPPVRAMGNLVHRRLHGSLFSDLGVLRAVLPESPAVKHLLADVHRILGQWELASPLYRQVLEAESQNLTALVDLGAYHFYRGDFGNAIRHFQQATAVDPRSAAAFYNLSQAYSESYLFDESREALWQARKIDDLKVGRWIQRATEERVVVLDGGMARISEIRRQLQTEWRGATSSEAVEILRRSLSLLFALGVIVVAVALHLTRRQFGYGEVPMGEALLGNRLRQLGRVLVPGLAAAEEGTGFRAFLALLLPVALLLLPLGDILTYRIPWGYDPGKFLHWIVSLGGLVTYLGVRARWAFRAVQG